LLACGYENSAFQAVSFNISIPVHIHNQDLLTQTASKNYFTHWLQRYTIAANA
jgi:hypothetical protein